MAEEQKQSVPQQSAPKQDDADEVLVRQADGTFRMMKVSSSGGATALPQKPAPQPSATPPALGGALLDEEEKKELATFAKVGSTTERKTEDDRHRARAAHVIQQAGVTLADESLRNRLTMALLARLKEIRDDVETRETLTRRVDQGGVGLNDNDANRLLAALKGKAQPKQQLQSTVQNLQPTTYNLQPLPPPPPPRIPPPTAKPVPPVRPAPPRPSPPLQRQATSNKRQETRLPSSPPQPKVQNLQPSTFNLQPPPPPPPRKPRVQDVSFTPTLRGPVSELKMEISEWRRIGASLADRSAKVEEKLALLQEESYVERLAGIQAWRESGVVRLYREIATEALTTNRRVEEIVKERERTGQPTLSKDEFTSIAQLNAKLRF